MNIVVKSENNVPYSDGVKNGIEIELEYENFTDVAEGVNLAIYEDCDFLEKRLIVNAVISTEDILKIDEYINSKKY